MPLEGEEIYAALQRHMDNGVVSQVHVIVPVSLRDRFPWESAKHRLDGAVERIRALGMSASGELGDNDPYLALKDALDRDAYDRVLITTLKAGASRWVRMDLLSRAARLTDTPIERVETDAG